VRLSVQAFQKTQSKAATQITSKANPYPAFCYTYSLPEDANMQKLWQSFEHYLLTKFPKASTLATPFNDPIAESIDEYQAFLKTLGYSPLVQGAFGKTL